MHDISQMGKSWRRKKNDEEKQWGGECPETLQFLGGGRVVKVTASDGAWAGWVPRKWLVWREGFISDTISANVLWPLRELGFPPFGTALWPVCSSASPCTMGERLGRWAGATCQVPLATGVPFRRRFCQEDPPALAQMPSTGLLLGPGRWPLFFPVGFWVVIPGVCRASHSGYSGETG